MDALSGTFHPAAAITGRMRHEGADADVDLMRQTAAGDRDAFARLYRKHHATVFRFSTPAELQAWLDSLSGAKTVCPLGSGIGPSARRT